MYNLLLAIIYLAFIGLGIPDSLLGAAWPAMYKDFDAPLFGVIANNVSVVLLPAFLLVLTVLMVLMHEKLLRGTKALES
ncbi:hypothetical protein [Rothia terrae]|uniref:Uncharacterized protein n=1 Tax=Rothia terrae TaxID=396015 RepID=A0A7H2BH03_9MICC|nr:hypothetical protein [Rothia terrae]QNV38949.1 hypothetical protein IDM49_09485 [Rothia terrae]